MEERVRIFSIGLITRNVIQIFTDKPQNFEFVPGQATEISIDKPGWENERRPFTFTSLPDDSFLQFSIKTYPERKGVTNELLTLRKNDHLILHDIFGAIEYKGEGTFIAGGAGATPFISILRSLKYKNEIGNSRLIFANKTKDDIILKYEFEKMLGSNFINILSDEKTEGYYHGHLTREFLGEKIADLKKHIYLCGPPPMMEAVERYLTELGFNMNYLVKEED
jgi:ferredoxin-NADP reductase